MTKNMFGKDAEDVYIKVPIGSVVYDKTTNKALADVICLADEIISEDSYTIFDPENPWKKKTLSKLCTCVTDVCSIRIIKSPKIA
mgnify:CR=1 FL=1